MARSKAWLEVAVDVVGSCDSGPENAVAALVAPVPAVTGSVCVVKGLGCLLRLSARFARCLVGLPVGLLAGCFAVAHLSTDAAVMDHPDLAAVRARRREDGGAALARVSPRLLLFARDPCR